MSAAATSAVRRPQMSPATGAHGPRTSPEATFQAVSSAARCGDVLASPPGLVDCATPAKLWPATPFLDGARLGSPSTLATIDKASGPEALLFSPPGLDCQAWTPSLPIPSDKFGRSKQKKVTDASAKQVPANISKGKVSHAPGVWDRDAKPGKSQHGKAQPSKPQPSKAREEARRAKQEAKRKASADEELVPAGPKMPAAAEIIQAMPSNCSICEALVPATLAEANADPNRFFMEGSTSHLVCSDCHSIFEPDGFVPRYHVCGNPLCRRKWKQLTPKVLTLFCPSCKRQLEEGVGEANTMLELAATEQMYQRWHEIYEEMAVALGYRDPPKAAARRCSKVPVNADEIRSRWHSLLSEFQTSFPAEPSLEDVRNWNSVHGRRIYYRGAINRGNTRFFCTVKAEVELNEDLKTQKRALGGAKEYYFLDWHGRLKDGDEVHFIAFPNPAVKERDRVSRIVRLLTPNEGADALEPAPSEPAIVSMPRPPSPLQVASDHLSPARHGEVTLITPPTPDEMPMKLALVPSPTHVDLPTPSPAIAPSSAPAAVANPAQSPACLPTVVLAETEAVDTTSNGERGSQCSDAEEGLDDLSPCSPFAGAHFGSFADLMQWSQDCPDVEPTPAGAKPPPGDAKQKGQNAAPLMPRGAAASSGSRMRPPLPIGSPPNATLAPPMPLGSPALRPPLPPVGSPVSSSGSPALKPPTPSPGSGSSPALRPRGSPSAPHGHPPTGAPVAKAARGKLMTPSPKFGTAPPGRSPMLCPRSPYAAYFDD